MASQAHDFWQHQFLHTAGLPVNSFTVYFLSEWAQYENATRCDHNPIQLSHREPGSSRCKRLPGGRYARNYTDTQSAANAFADQLTLTAYPELRKAVASGNPFTYENRDAVALELQKWGSVAFQKGYSDLVHITAEGSSPGPVPQSKNVGAAWSHLMRTLARDGHATIVELRRATASLNRIERRLRRA